MIMNACTFDHEVQYFGKLANKNTGKVWIQNASYSVSGKKDAEGKRERAYMNITVFSDEEILSKPGFYNVTGKLSFTVYNGKISLSVNEASATFIETAEQRFGPKAKKAEDEDIAF
jgi:hypothetical protein